MKLCYRVDCLNHDRRKPGNCWEFGGAARPEGRCGEYASADSLMRMFRCGCHKDARGRWVADKTTVYR